VLHRYVLRNDRIVEAGSRELAAGQVGLLSGWGVFTTLRVAEGVLFAFERHWARIGRDARLFHVEIPTDPESLRRRLLALVEANQAPNCTLRLAIVRNRGGMWQGPDTGSASDILALTADSKDWGEGVKLCYQTQARHSACMFAGAKILSWAQNLTWLEIAQQKGCDEVILLNERGEVSECTSANIFIANGGQVWTPPLASSGCLPGITREVLLNEVNVPGIVIGEKEIVPWELEAADEVFITSTTRDLLPVLAVEGTPVGRGERVRTVLQRAFSERLHKYIAEHRAQPVGR
jgi:branched-chain amino acid aminotransferase